MTYQIYYLAEGQESNNRGNTLFDIEYYLTHNDDGDYWFSDYWFSDIHCLPIVEGIARFLKDRLNDENFDFETFIKDAEVIQEIRGILFEKFDNKPKPSDEARNFHYKIFGKKLREIIEDFANKYGLFINID